MMPDSDAAFFFTQVLLRLGARVVAGNSLQFMLKWRAFEQSPTGPDAEWNPLNTTRSVDENSVPLQHTEFNSTGVNNFPDEHTGVIATAATLGNGLYSRTLEALLTGNFIVTGAMGISAEIAKWGTSGFANYIAVHGLDEWASQSAPIPVPAPSPLTADQINEAMQWRFYLLRLAALPDISVVERAYDILQSAGVVELTKA